MAAGKRPAPRLLAKKLLRIRQHLGIGQLEMYRRLKQVPGGPPGGSMVSRYERGERQPNLLVLIAYAELAEIIVDPIIDDRWNMELFEWALNSKSLEKIVKRRPK